MNVINQSYILFYLQRDCSRSVGRPLKTKLTPLLFFPIINTPPLFRLPLRTQKPFSFSFFVLYYYCFSLLNFFLVESSGHDCEHLRGPFRSCFTVFTLRFVSSGSIPPSVDESRSRDLNHFFFSAREAKLLLNLR